MLSLVIPVYKNEANLERLFSALQELDRELAEPMEVVFVVDGSPDRCLEILSARLPDLPLRSRLLSLSRNFGSFAAIGAGLQAGTGDYFAVLAADLQEPMELMHTFTTTLRNGEADVVFGCRSGRSDPWLSTLVSNYFWDVYRTLVVRDMPKGGVDIFACTRQVRDRLLEFPEANTNLIALLFWVGFRRKFVQYQRQARQEGKSAWTFSKKWQYCLDSIFNFTDLPVRLLLYVGFAGVGIAVVFGVTLLLLKFWGLIPVPGYTAIVFSVVFFGGLTSLAFGIIGQYLWLTLQNARRRPLFIVASSREIHALPADEMHSDANSPTDGS